MNPRFKVTGLLLAGVLCFPIAGRADNTQVTHRVHRVKKQQPAPLPPLPSGPRGPVPQVPLDAIAPVAPQVTFQDGLLTIVAPNSTLGDILRGVRKHTSAEIDVPATASERVVTRLGPGQPREVMAELLNGSRFNYVLLGSPQDANALVRVVLVAKSGAEAGGPNSPAPGPGAQAPDNNAEAANDAPDAPEAQEDNSDEQADQQSAEAEQPQQGPSSDQPGIKTPQQLLQEMQQRQMLMQQQQAGSPGVYPIPGMRPPAPPTDPQ